MASNIVAGIASFRVNGSQYQLRGSFNIGIYDIERTGVAGQDTVHGFTEKLRVPFIEGEISDNGGLSLEELKKLTDVTVEANLANGKSYVLRNAWLASSPDLDASEGKMTLRFEGLKGEEVL